MSSPKTPLALVLALSALAADASAQIIVPVSQDRSLYCDAELGLGGGPMSTDSATAPDFAPFSAVVSARESDPSNSSLADSGAWQDSSITADRVQARGSFFATVEYFFTEAEARNNCTFVFDVTQTSSFRVFGQVEAYDYGGANVRIYEENTGATLYSAAAIGFSSTFPFDVEGVVYPGRYVFEARGGGWVQDGNSFEYASGAYDVDLQLSAIDQDDCVATPNSSGDIAVLAMAGEHRVGSFETYWGVSGGPAGHFGILFYGDAMTPAAFGNGVLCVSNPLYRVPGVEQFDGNGATNGELYYYGVPTGQGPGQIFPGSTWTFQYWFRDVPNPGGDGWNTSTTSTVTFAN